MGRNLTGVERKTPTIYAKIEVDKIYPNDEHTFTQRQKIIVMHTKSLRY